MQPGYVTTEAALKPRSEAARRELARFRAAHAILREKARMHSVMVAVIGPTPLGDSTAAKACREICTNLREAGFNAPLYEGVAKNKVPERERPKALRYWHARSAALLIAIMEDSPEAIAEVSALAKHDVYARKMMVVAPRNCRETYGAHGPLKDLEDAYGGVSWYADETPAPSALLGRVLHRAEALRQVAYRLRMVRDDDH